MEHFEVHKEHLQDLFLEIQQKGDETFQNLPADEKLNIDQDHLAYIDELSGLTDFTEHIIHEKNLPLGIQNRLRADVIPYTNKKSKDLIAFEVHQKFFVRQR